MLGFSYLTEKLDSTVLYTNPDEEKPFGEKKIKELRICDLRQLDDYIKKGDNISKNKITESDWAYNIVDTNLKKFHEIVEKQCQPYQNAEYSVLSDSLFIIDESSDEILFIVANIFRECMKYGHYQPRIPADLGFYDLRVPETREAQAQLARDAGIEGFCYWHYWFDENHQLLERPFNEVLKSGKPNFPFCLAWANESWYAKLWDKDVRKDKLLIEQKYDGIAQYTKHFYDVLPAFKDERYIKQDGKPIFVIYKPLASPEISIFIKTWRELAKKNGLEGIYFVGHCINDRKNISKYFELDLDAVNTCCLNDYTSKRNFFGKTFYYVYRHLFKKPFVIPYKKVSKMFFDKSTDENEKVCPSIIVGWDHTPRSTKNGTVFTKETPEQFSAHVKTVLENAKGKFIFVKSWNEWAEKDIVIFPNGVTEAMLSFVLERLKADKTEQIFLYVCTLSPVADKDKTVWLGGEEVRKSVIGAFCEDGHAQVIYDSCREFAADDIPEAV